MRFARSREKPSLRKVEQRPLVRSEADEPIITPAVPFQRSLKSWLYWRIWRNPLLEVPENHPEIPQLYENMPGLLRVLTWLAVDGQVHWKAVSIRGLFLRAFLTAYEFDGFDFTNNTVTCADHAEPIPFEASHLSWRLLLSSFLGLPNRPAAVWDKKLKRFVPELTGKQLLKNFFGGWFSLYHYEGKMDPKTGFISSITKVRKWDAWWQLITLPLKILVIFPLKLLVIAGKIFINTLKLFTEILLPIVVLPLIRFVIALAMIVPSTIFTKLTQMVVPPFFAAVKRGHWAVVPLFIIGFPIVFLTFAIQLLGLAVNVTSRLITIVLRAIFSPEKSARMAFAYGRELKGEILGIKIGNIVGVLGAALSVAISVVAWTFLFPLLIGAVAGIFPAVMQAVTWMANLPFVATSVGALQGGVTTVGTALGAAFGPAITFIATALSVQVSAAALVVGTTFGMLLTPVLLIASRVADDLSNWWTRHEGGRFTVINKGKLTEKSLSSDGDSKSLLGGKDETPMDLLKKGSVATPGKDARGLAGARSDALDDSEKRLNKAEGAAGAVSTPAPALASAGAPVVESAATGLGFPEPPTGHDFT